MTRRSTGILATALSLICLHSVSAATATAAAPAPGDVVSATAIWAPGFEYARVWRITYRSTSATGTSTTVSGTVIVPNGSTSTTPIVGYAPGTHGLGDHCAPSRHLQAGDEGEGGLIHQYAWKGFAVAVTDYQGLGTPGTHTYSVGRAQGHAVLDIVRAAQRLPATGLGRNAPVAVVGYSQGGQTAGWAAQLAPTYARELNVKGFAVGAPPADLSRVAQYNTDDPDSGFVLAAGVGLDAAYPELRLADALTATGKAAAADISDDCTADFTKYANTSLDDYTVTPGLMDRPDWAARVAEQTIGDTKPQSPVLLYQSTADEIIPLDVATTLRSKWCGLGANLTYWQTDTGAHSQTAALLSPQVTGWVADRLAGRRTSTGC